MEPSHQSRVEQAYVDLIWQIFRTNVQLYRHGNQIAAAENMTVGRWQLIGALAARPSNVAQLALEWGFSRQGIQRTVNWLVAAGLAELVPNPKHKRSKLVQLTPEGHELRTRLVPSQRAWMRRVSSKMSEEELFETSRTLEKMRQYLEEDSFKR